MRITMLRQPFTRLLTLTLVLLLGLGIFVAGCDDETVKQNDQKELHLATSNYVDAIAIQYLAKGILETEMGYRVEMTRADLGGIFSSMADGDVDAYLATWLPVTHGSYMEEFGDDLEDLGMTYEGANLGLVVPDYVDIDSIEELNHQKDKFQEDQIVGIDSGAGIMELAEDAVKKYDLDLELLYSSDHAMTASLKDTVEDEDWIVVTGWTPHLKFHRFDLKFLEDPHNIFGEEENVYTKARSGFKEDSPEAAALLENIYLTDEEYGELIHIFEEYEQGEELQAAEEWIEKNSQKVADWIPEGDDSGESY